jgi:hypothetical protein
MKWAIFLFIFFSFLNNAICQWTHCYSSDESLTSIYADTTGLVLVGGMSGALLKSKDFGGTFRRVETNTQSEFQKIIKVNDSLIVARVGSNHPVIGWKLFVSTDEGETWFSNNSPDFNFHQLQFVDGTLYIMPWANNGGRNDIYKSIDNGKTWNMINQIPKLEAINKLLIVNDSCWYAIGNTGFIGYTSDMGLNWKEQAQGLAYAKLLDIIKVHDTVAVIVGDYEIPTSRYYPILTTLYNKDEWIGVSSLNFYQGGKFSHSGKYWWITTDFQNGMEFSNSIKNWEGMKLELRQSLSELTWIDNRGNGFALLYNSILKTTNHGIDPLSVKEESIQDGYITEYEYYNTIGQRVSPSRNQLLLKVNKRFGKVEKVVFSE